MKIENKITSDRDHDKYITIQELRDLTAQIFASRSGKANLANKNDIANFVKKNKKNQICSVNISNDFTINNVKKTRLKGIVNFFSVALILLIQTIF